MQGLYKIDHNSRKKLKGEKLETQAKKSRFRQNQKCGLPKIGRKKAELNRYRYWPHPWDQTELESKQAEGTKIEEKIASVTAELEKTKVSNQSATAELEKIKQSNQELERQMEEFMRKAAAPVSDAAYELPGRITGPEVCRNQVPQVPLDS